MSDKDPSEKPVDALKRAEAEAELKRLAALIRHHDELYYRQDAPEVSDAQYDTLRRRNEAIEERFPKLVRPDSPSKRVGAPAVEGFGKIKHRVPMLSLGNAFDAEEGEYVSKNVLTIREIPHQLKGKKIPEIIDVRGEIYMTRDDFARLNE